MASKFYLHKLSKKAKAEQGRPWVYTDEIKEYDGEYQTEILLRFITTNTSLLVKAI